MSRQNNMYSLEKVLCTRGKKQSAEVAVNGGQVSAEVRDLLSKVSLTIGTVSFEEIKVAKHGIISTETLETV